MVYARGSALAAAPDQRYANAIDRKLIHVRSHVDYSVGVGEGGREGSSAQLAGVGARAVTATVLVDCISSR